MIVAIAGALVLLLAGTAVVIYAKDPGPLPVDIAIAYELAWDRFDFDALWTLSGPNLRDGLDKKQFVAAKASAYTDRSELAHLAGQVDVEVAESVGDVSVIRTRLTLRDGSVIHNEVSLLRNAFGWSVTGYVLAGTDGA